MLNQNRLERSSLGKPQPLLTLPGYVFPRPGWSQLNTTRYDFSPYAELLVLFISFTENTARYLHLFSPIRTKLVSINHVTVFDIFIQRFHSLMV